MVLWRISPFHDLNGVGGMRFSARWNIAGTPMVYLADSAASALLETCVHTSADRVPATYTLLKVIAPETLVEEVALSNLPQDWVNQLPVTQSLGAEWLKSGRSALLRVPSVLVPETWNVMFNPLHPDGALFRIERHYDYPFDLRLKN
jgi:RES domain-containing protein